MAEQTPEAESTLKQLNASKLIVEKNSAYCCNNNRVNFFFFFIVDADLIMSLLKKVYDE